MGWDGMGANAKASSRLAVRTVCVMSHVVTVSSHAARSLLLPNCAFSASPVGRYIRLDWMGNLQLIPVLKPYTAGID